MVWLQSWRFERPFLVHYDQFSSAGTGSCRRIVSGPAIRAGSNKFPHSSRYAAKEMKGIPGRRYSHYWETGITVCEWRDADGARRSRAQIPAGTAGLLLGFNRGMQQID